MHLRHVMLCTIDEYQICVEYIEIEHPRKFTNNNTSTLPPLPSAKFQN